MLSIISFEITGIGLNHYLMYLWFEALIVKHFSNVGTTTFHVMKRVKVLSPVCNKINDLKEISKNITRTSIY